MITRSDIIDALTMCVGYDPIHAPKQSEIITDAWVKHFEGLPQVTPRELLDAVNTYYRAPQQQPWPQPGVISGIARAAIKDRADREPIEHNRVPASPEVVADARAQIAKAINRFGRME